MALRLAILALIGVGCGVAVADEVPLPHPRPPAWFEPRSFAEAAGPGFDSAAVTAEPTDCDRRLAAIAAFAPMPRLIGPDQCGGGDVVELDAVLLADNARVDIKPAPVLRCVMAEQFATWLREDASQRLAALGSNLRAVENFDDFECRSRNRLLGARLSEHGKANAVDVRAFVLADGRVIEPTDITVAKDVRETLRESACQRFTTVLGPGADGHHEAHIHLDLAERPHGYRICEWDVREPASNIAQVPLPVPRPPIPELAVNGVQKL